MHGQVGRRLAIRHRGAFEHAPALGVLGVHGLVDEARLPHARLAHQRHHLAMPGASPGQGLREGI